MINLYAVIGNPVEHSLSPELHAEFIKQINQQIKFIKILAPTDGFEKAMNDFREQGGKGLAVTVPFKKDAFELADSHSEHCITAGRASVLKFLDDRTIRAENFDGVGLIADIKNNLNFSLKNKSILIVGAGGASRGILQPISEQGPNSITIANRTLARAQQIQNDFKTISQNIKACSLNDIPNDDYDFIINATSSALSKATLDIPSYIVSKNTLCYDLSYTKDHQTPFLTWCKQNGTTNCHDGYGMLVEQGAIAFELWFGVYPETSSFYPNRT